MPKSRSRGTVEVCNAPFLNRQLTNATCKLIEGVAVIQSTNNIYMCSLSYRSRTECFLFEIVISSEKSHYIFFKRIKYQSIGLETFTRLCYIRFM